MITVTLNTAGKRTTSYITKEVDRKVSLNGKLKTKISVKEAKELIKDKEVYYEGFNFKTYKID